MNYKHCICLIMYHVIASSNAGSLKAANALSSDVIHIGGRSVNDDGNAGVLSKLQLKKNILEEMLKETFNKISHVRKVNPKRIQLDAQSNSLDQRERFTDHGPPGPEYPPKGKREKGKSRSRSMPAKLHDSDANRKTPLSIEIDKLKAALRNYDNQGKHLASETTKAPTPATTNINAFSDSYRELSELDKALHRLLKGNHASGMAEQGTKTQNGSIRR